MQAIPFRTREEGCGCCGTSWYCTGKIHLAGHLVNDRKMTWEVIGACDGHCQIQLPPEAVELVENFLAQPGA